MNRRIGDSPTERRAQAAEAGARSGPAAAPDTLGASGASSGASGVSSGASSLPATPVMVAGSRATLDREMREIKDDVLRMGSIVADQIRAALAALTSHDVDAALAVIIADRRVNEVQRHVASLIATTIATQSPVARDLRFLLALDHVTYELERIGDHAASVAKQGRLLAPHPPLKRYVDLPEMGELAAHQVQGVLRALVDVDVTMAREVASRDDDIDHLFHRTYDEVVDLMRADPDNVERGTRIMFAAYYLERIGDRVTNIAEDVVFLATGDIEDLNQ